MPRGVSGEPVGGALDHDSSRFGFVVVPRYRPVLDVLGEKIIILFLPHPCIQGLHPLSFFRPPLLPDIDGERGPMSISPMVLVVPLTLGFLTWLLRGGDVWVEEGSRADVILAER